MSFPNRAEINKSPQMPPKITRLNLSLKQQPISRICSLFGLILAVLCAALPKLSAAAPTLSVGPLTVLEDGVYTFNSANFDLTGGNSGAINSIKITSIPTNGVLSLASVSVTNNQVIPYSEVGSLKYAPQENANGSIGFSLFANQVGNTDPSPAVTATISITAVNDLPSANLVVVTNVAGVTWSSLTIASKSWQSIASSSNGQTLVGVVDGGNVYTSNNQGEVWIERDSSRNWEAVASSTDGTKLVAVVQNGFVYTSSDSGATWTQRTTAGSLPWSSVASSADGSAIVATAALGKIYSSSDSGVTWLSRATSLNWSDIASSNDGNNLVASVFGDFIYTSTDRGTNWTQRASGKLWATVASSANGSKLVAAEFNGSISTSSDSGVTWIEQAGSGIGAWSSLASSADGMKLLASTSGGKLYTSFDSGVTWVARDSNRNWSAVASSANGDTLFASVYGGILYRSFDQFVPSSVTFAEDSGVFTNANFLTASAGPANESNQTLSFVLSGFNTSSFLVPPAISSTGTLTFTPATNFFGTETVTVNVNDGLDTVSATQLDRFKIVVTNTDDAPVLGSLTINGTEDVVMAFNSSTFTTNYSTIDTLAVKPAVSYTIETLPSKGSLFLSGVPVTQSQIITAANVSNLTYVPQLNTSGTNVFRVSASDGILSSPKGTNAALVTLVFSPVNNPPVAVAQVLSAVEDTALSILLSGTDADGDALTISVVDGPINGTFSGSVYIPNPNYSGLDRINFKVKDASLFSLVETVSITVVPVNDAPVLGAVVVAGSEETTFSFSAAIFSSKYSDVESDPLASITVKTLPPTGALKLGDTLVTASQVIPVAQLSGLTYTPSANEFGPKTFTVVASDGVTSSAATTVTVVLANLPDAPTLVSFSKSLNEDSTLVFASDDFSSKYTDFDTNGVTLASIKIQSLPTVGVLKNATTNAVVGLELTTSQIGGLTYNRGLNLNGEESFTVSASDGTRWSAPAVVTLIVVPVNDAPSVTIPALTQKYVGQNLATNANLPLVAWKSVSSSSDGSKLVAVADNDNIYVSSNSGANWLAKADVRQWNSVASSLNGQVLAATVKQGKIYVSSDSGTSWIERDSDRAWRSIAVSSNIMAAVVNNGKIYVSLDSGTTWTAGGTDQLWNSVAVSADGSRLLASVFGGSLYTSSNKGTNWTAVASPKFWNSVALNADGSKMVATESGKKIWTSGDSGATWVASANAGDKNWSSVAISADGTRILAGVNAGKLNLSIDGGINWMEQSSSASWSSLAGSVDLKKVVVTAIGSSVYTSSDFTIDLEITVLEDSGAYTYANFATSPSTGPANEASQTLSYSVSVSNLSFAHGTNLFVGTPTIDSNGTLSFVSAPNAIGSARLTVTVKDSGGLTNILGTQQGVDAAQVGNFMVVVTQVDDIPTAVSQNVVVIEDTLKAITLTGSDPENSVLTFRIVEAPSKGVVSATNLSTFNYTPNANAVGADSFKFWVADSTSTSAVATVSITITNVNDLPVATPKSVSTEEDTALTIALDGTDADNDALTYSVVTVPTKGTLTGTGSTRVYTPTANLSGQDSFTFKVNDGLGDSAANATVAITIIPVNDSPTATNQVVNLVEGGVKNIVLTGSGVETGRSLVYTVLTQPKKGVLTGALTGTTVSLDYTPSSKQNGSDSFTFKVSDGFENSGVGTVTLNITNINDIPTFDIPIAKKPGGENPVWTKLTNAIAAWNGVSLSTNGSMVAVSSSTSLLISTDGGNTSTNAMLPGSGAFKAVAVSASGSKILAARGDQLYTYSGGNWTSSSTPPSASWVSVASSADGVKLAAVGSNKMPYVSTNSGSTWASVGTAHDWQSIASSSDGSKLAAAAYNGAIYTTVDGGTNWTARTVVGSANRYWSSIASSADGLKLVAAELNDQIFTSADGGVTWSARDSKRAWSSVSSSSDGKFLVAGVYGGKLYYSDDSGLTWTAKDQDRVWGSVGIAGDSGNAVAAVIDGALYRALGYDTESTVTVLEDEVINLPSFATNISAGPLESNQVLTFVLTSSNTNLFSVGPSISASGTLSFTPAANATGTASVEVYLQDDGGTAAGGVNKSVTKKFNVVITPVNDAPVAVSQTVTTGEDTAKVITLTGTDAEGSPLSYTIGRSPIKGTLSLTGNNLVYTPFANENGADNFTFKVNDGALDSTASLVTVVISAVNDQPIVSNQSLPTNEDIALPITLAGSDVDGDQLAYTVLTLPRLGVLTGTEPNLVFLPSPNISGTDSFTYKVNDGSVDSIVATVSITIAAVNDVPLASALSVEAVEDTATVITLAGVDLEGSALTYTLVTPPTKGVLSGTAPIVTYTPNINANGADSFAYSVNDGAAESALAAVAISIAAVNDAPVAGTLIVQAVEDTATEITLTGTDVEGSDLSYTVVTGPSKGSLTGTAPNLVYTPDADTTGSDSFTYTVNDGLLDSALSTVAIEVTAVNDAPVANSLTVEAVEDTESAVVLAGSDVDRDALSYTIVLEPVNGKLTGTAPNLVYTPNLDVSGADSFTYKINDGTADSDVATVSITVAAVNDAPVATSLTVDAVENTAKEITLTAFDVEGSEIYYSVATAPKNGVLTGTAPNIIYTPNSNVSGSDSFTFTVNDGTDNSAEATVVIEVAGVNDAPEAFDVAVQTEQDARTEFSLAGSDPEGSTLTYTVLTGPTKGTLSGTEPNLVYAPNPGASGVDTITYTVNDGTLDSAIATVTIDIAASEPPTMTIKAARGGDLVLEVRAPVDAVLTVEASTVIGQWFATETKVIGKGMDEAVPLTLKIDPKVSVRFWRLKGL
ncbi:MAG: tandem-95 repeat protein [Pedosphaera sp.]|nr:tandem-95 repeat protein [Pedosphaera sp.]